MKTQPAADRSAQAGANVATRDPASCETEAGPVFWVLDRNLPELRRRVARLARRAERLGTGPLALRDTGRRDGERTCVVLEGEPPSLAGWTLAAVVEHDSAEATLRVVTARVPDLDRQRFEQPRCEHCRLRRRRTETFVVWHAETRRLRQVGSGCLRVFLGGHDPERICRQAEYLLLAEQALRNAGTTSGPADRAEEGVPLGEFAAHAARVLRADGWVSRQRARESSRTASADAVQRSLRDTPDAPDASDRSLAHAALCWARDLLGAVAQLSEFERDAVTVASTDRLLTARERGLACALVAVYRKRRARSRHVGAPGERFDGLVLVERVIEIDSRRHGQVRRHDLIDVDGNRFAWWQTRGAPLPLGRATHIDASVERHTRFGRAHVTVLTRCHAVDRSESIDRQR